MVAEYDDSGRPDQTFGNTGPGAKLNIISFVGVVLGLLLIVNRLFWRWKKGTPGIDDVIIVIAWLALVGLGIVTYIAVDYGYGRSTAYLTRAEASDALRMFYLYQIFYKLTLNLSKLSILTLYLRVFDTKDWFGYITKFLIFIVTTFTTSIILANIFVCNPISMYWSTTDKPGNNNSHGSCINILAFWYASSLYNIFSETFMLLSVLARIWTLPSHSHPPILQFRQKINLTIVLGLGVFTVITAILRMTTLNQTAMASDRTGGTLISTIWSSIEASLGLAVANLPMIRQLLRWRGWCGAQWFRSSAEKSRSQSRSQGRRGTRTGSGYIPGTPAAAARNNTDSRTRSRDQSSAGLLPYASPRSYAHAHSPLSHPYARSQDSPMTLPEISSSSHEIHLQRDFQREVITSHDHDHASATSSPDLSREHNYSSKTLPGNSFLTNNNNTLSDYDTPSHKYTDTPTPSIVSTSRSPTEPVPMVRISTEPTSTSSSTSMGPKNYSSASLVTSAFTIMK